VVTSGTGHLPVPVSSGGTLTASRSPHGDAERIWKPGKSFKRSAEIFSSKRCDGKSIVARAFSLSPGFAAGPLSAASLLRPTPNPRSVPMESRRVQSMLGREAGTSRHVITAYVIWYQEPDAEHVDRLLRLRPSSSSTRTVEEPGCGSRSPVRTAERNRSSAERHWRYGWS
jgi:hypothetical protein